MFAPYIYVRARMREEQSPPVAELPIQPRGTQREKRRGYQRSIVTTNDYLLQTEIA